MKFVLVLCCLWSSAVSRPQLAEVKELVSDTGSGISVSVKKVGGAIHTIAKDVVVGAHRVGKEVGGLVEDVLDEGVKAVHGAKGAVETIAVGSVGGARQLVGATKNYVKENAVDVGEFASKTFHGKLGTALVVVESTGNYASNLTGATVGLLQRVFGAGGKLIIDIVANTVDLAKGAKNVIGNVADGAVNAITGYEKHSPTIQN